MQIRCGPATVTGEPVLTFCHWPDGGREGEDGAMIREPGYRPRTYVPSTRMELTRMPKLPAAMNEASRLHLSHLRELRTVALC